jgi:lysophospholipase L1-like esterase
MTKSQTIRILSAVHCFCLAAFRLSAQAEGIPDPAVNLGWFAEKVRNGEPVRIGFIGGSITLGAGASKPWKNYISEAARIIKPALAEHGASAEFKNAGVGGTGSAYGAIRVGPQLLENGLDLLIVEFAVNDNGDAGAADSMEGIVRQALRANPKIGMLFFYTTTAVLDRDFYKNKTLPPGVLAHQSVASHYGIKEVISGPQVAAAIEAGELSAESFFKDGVHPTDEGHAFYGKLLGDAVIKALETPKPSAEPPALPPLLGSGKWEWTRMEPIEPLGSTEGWTFQKASYFHPFGSWKADVEGVSLRFAAKGKTIGLLFQSIFAGEISLDGKPLPTWNAPGRKDGIPSFRMLSENGESREHIIEVRSITPKSGEMNVVLSGIISTDTPADNNAREKLR